VTGLAAALLLTAVGLLVAGLVEDSVPLQWSSFAASALAAATLAVAELRRRRTGGPAASAAGLTEPPARTAGRGALVTSPPEAAPVEPGAAAVDPTGPATGGHAAAPPPAAGEPPVEEVEVTDLLLVLDLTDEVLVVDEHPRYHLPGCPHTAGVATIGMPLVEARTDGFTPCGTCTPDRTLAGRERARRA
jgi:hypothetical protein